MTNLGLSSSSDVITFDQNWHHLYSTSAGGKDLSNDAQIRVIGQVEPQICTKMLKKLIEKRGAKFPATTRGRSMLKITHLDDAFSEVFSSQASPVEGQSLQQKKREKEKKETRKKNPQIEKPKDVGHFLVCACQSHNARKRDCY